MATPTLNTRLSRRTILAGGVATPALAFPVIQAITNPPDPALSSSEPAADAELFRRIAVAEHFRNRHARMQRLRARLPAMPDAPDDLMPLPFRDNCAKPWLHCWESFERYATAVRDAIAVPAFTVTGIHAKLRLGAIAARQGAARVYMYEDREWLEIVIADLRRLAHDVPTTK